MKTYLFSLCHPAHYHMFKHLMRYLSDKGNKVVVVVRPKDVLERLCDEAGLLYYSVGHYSDKYGLKGKASVLISRVKDMARIVKKEKPCMLIGSDGVLAYVGKRFHIPSFEFNDDDYEVVRLYSYMFYPFYSDIVGPRVTDVGRWKGKKTEYEGYQKLAYLHPNCFTPDKSVVEKYFPSDRPYFLLRFARLTAHHDVGINGIDSEVAAHLVEMLKPHGDVYITAERALEPQLEPYRLHIDPSDMHHVLAFAHLFVGDSQSMAGEAAILGIPSLRFNDFAGRINVLEELEHKYELTFAFPTTQPQRLYEKVEELLAMPDLRKTFQQRRQKMLSEKIDVTAFFNWFIENYPESRKIMRENPDYQWRFR